MNQRLHQLLSALFALFLLTSCQQEIQAPAVPVAAFSLLDSSGNCLPDSVHGTYRAGQPLGDTNFIEVTVQVTTPGLITLSSGPQNGITFSGTAQPTAAGPVRVRLAGSGTPAAAGATTISLSQGGASCPIVLTVAPAAPSGGGPAGGACVGTVTGTFKKDSLLGPGHRIAISHTFLASGTFRVHTDTVNGYSFSADVTVPTAGMLRVADMQATGRPLQVGSDTFTVRFGDGDTCTFRIDVVAGTPPPGGGSVPDTTMLPLAVGNWWSYDHAATLNGIDTITVTVIGTKTVAGKTYFEARRNSGIHGTQYAYGTADDTLLFRKDPNGSVYQLVRIQNEFGGWVPYTFAEPYVELALYLPGKVPGDEWFTNSFTGTGASGTRQFRVRVALANIGGISLNGYNFPNTWNTHVELQTTDGGGAPWMLAPGFPSFRSKMLVRGVGIVLEVVGSRQNQIRYWRFQ
ncbi:hypothetical protein [Flaviaesturariibacter amylovorans]|uniref:Uncharacterized protein n=1 Tax=Flaviaesturariibacter amylovorans TaxID=1084520 RepID=A0ABP8G5M1_9BACT